MNEASQLPPRPLPAPEYPAYWHALREHRLVAQRCSACGTLRHYPRPLCGSCHSFDYDWAELSGRGTVYSWTVCHHPFHLAFKREAPYTMLTVTLEEGVRLQAPLCGGGSAVPAIGQAVTVGFVDCGDDLTLPCFHLDGATG